MTTVYYTDSTPGTAVSLLNETASLADWASRIQMTEGTGANTGRWSATVTTPGRYKIFEGTAQPALPKDNVGTIVVVGDPTVNIQPSIGIGARDVASDVIEIATDAARTISRSVLDEDLDPVTLPSSCEFVITDSNKALVATLTPTISGSSYSVTLPRSILKQEQDLSFALRNADSTKLDFDSGVLRVVYVAFDPT